MKKYKRILAFFMMNCVLVGSLSGCTFNSAAKVAPTTGEISRAPFTTDGDDITSTPEISANPSESPKPTDAATPTEEPVPTEEPAPTEEPVPVPVVNNNNGELSGFMSNPNWSDAVEVPITYDYVISKVKEDMNIRSGPGTEYEIIGKFRLLSYARIIERLDGWTKIESGDVIGYVCNDYLYMDEEAIAYVASMDAFQVKITCNEMNVREEPNTDCNIIGKAFRDEEYTWYPDLSSDKWYAIQYTEDTIAYVSATYTESVSKLGNALTMEQEAVRARAEMFAKAMEYSKRNPPSQVNREETPMTDEELYLMSVVIAMEALWEPYEGKLMVANVIINRMKNGYWGKTLKEVVYAPGQFTGANSGRIEAFWNRANEDCKRAAYEAMMGNNNIGDFLFFISIGKAEFDKYTKYYVFHGHCFYARNW